MFAPGRVVLGIAIVFLIAITLTVSEAIDTWLTGTTDET
jgi:hypothetical protein